MGLSQVFVKNLVRKRKSMGLTQAQFSELVGLSIRGYQKYEQGESSPTPDTLEAFARRLKCSPIELLSESAVMPEIAGGVREAIQILSALESLSPVLQASVLTLIFDDERYLAALKLPESHSKAVRTLRKIGEAP